MSRNPIRIEEPYNKELRDKIRAYVAEHGRPMRDGNGNPTYGWSADYKVQMHVYDDRDGEKCAWVVPEGVTLTEETYSMFAGTEASNEQEVGINVTGAHCACGKFTNVTLRCTDSLSDVLAYVLGVPAAVTEIRL